MNAIVSTLREDKWIARLLLAFVLFQLVGAAWDLPSAFSWENDGVAPRDVFGGIAFNLTPGKAHRYPLLHYVLLAIVSLPALLLGVFRAENFSLKALEQQMLSVEVMTGISIAAKVLAIVAACTAVVALARVARRTVTVDAGRFTALFAVTCLSFSYYGRVSNLDVPYLAWTALALDRLITVIERGEARDYRFFAVLVAASVATKDQAYASYVLPGLLYLVVWPAFDRTRVAAGAQHWKRLVSALGWGALALGALGGGLFNPTGFVQRLKMLTGTNSQDWRTYSSDTAGQLANLQDVVTLQSEFFWPWPMVAVAWLGVLLALRATPNRRLRLIPIVAAISSTLLFTLVVGRASHRFMLPLGFLLSFYGGVACDAGATWLRTRRQSWLVPVLATLLLVPAALRCGTLLLTQWCDARRDVEAWLQRVPKATLVETYGLLVYQPRFDTSDTSPYRTQHVGRRDIKVLGVTHVEASYGAVQERKPDVLVIAESYAARYLPEPERVGHVRSNQDLASLSDPDATAFMQAAVADRLPGYRLVMRADTQLPDWARMLGAMPTRIHGSTAAKLWVLAREGSDVQAL